ncbi:MFS transporter [Vitreoscilla massiliensis]|uniref:MFS transporter n=1 Tax=Vitreoscilla massiliensis TaxID=1689272 RepID=A0ABY4E3R2_9NEIS|nr:MFS transporter [Vitreoscilla massiliensis]UOO90415.1 MFS transporter [Vitreoscilla massiliensis]
MTQSKQVGWAPWLVIAAGIVAAMHIGKLPPTIPVLQQQLSLSLGQSGFLLAGIQVAGIAMALFVGLMAEKIGLKRLQVGGLLILAVASALGSFAHSFSALFAARLLEGFGFLSIVLVGPSLIKQLVPAHQLKLVLGFWAAYMGLGVAASLLLAPNLLHVLAWPRVWWIYASLALLMALLLWRFVPNVRVQHRDDTPPLAQLLKQTLSHPAPWLLGILFASYTSQWFAVTSFLPTIYANADIAATAAGVLTALVCLSNVGGPIVAGMMLQHGRPAWLLLTAGFVMMMVGAVVAFAGEGVLPFALQYCGVLLFSAGGGLIPGVVFAYVVYLAPSQQTVASTMGWVQQWSALGQFSLPPLMESLVTWWGSWRNAWMVCVVLGVVGIVCALRIQRLVKRMA